MISTPTLKKIKKGSDYAVWVVLIFVVGFITVTELDLNPMFSNASAETNEENELKMKKLSEMITDLKSIETKFMNLQETWKDKTMSVCLKAPKVINIFTEIASLDLKYDVRLLDHDKYFTLAKMLGLAYMMECTTFEYHQTHDMLSLAVQFQEMRTEYELKYGEF